MFENWFWVTVPFAAFALIGLLIYALGRYPRKAEPGKEESYTGGEDLPELRVEADNFYQVIRKALRISKLRHLQSGEVSDYLLWMVAGLTFLLIMVMLL
ncbi:MAG TPA: hypothetical protein VJ485_02460 [archaeon]|nr:hypothetical protein [archaeon]